MKKVIIISSIVLVLGTGLYYWYSKQIAFLYNLKYTIIGIKFNDISVDNTQFDLSLRIESQGTIEAEIIDLNVDVYVGGVLVGKVNSNTPIIVPARLSSGIPGYSISDLHVVTDPKQILNDGLGIAAQLLSNKDAVILINGFAKVKSAFLTIPVPVSYQTTLKEFLS